MRDGESWSCLSVGLLQERRQPLLYPVTKERLRHNIAHQCSPNSAFSVGAAVSAALSSVDREAAETAAPTALVSFCILRAFGHLTAPPDAQCWVADATLDQHSTSFNGKRVSRRAHPEIAKLSVVGNENPHPAGMGKRAGDGIRTHDVSLGKAAFCH